MPKHTAVIEESKKQV